MSLHFLKADVTTSQDLSLGALSYTTSSNSRKFKLEEVTLHFSVAVTETVTITRDKAVGANYDDVLAKRPMVAEQDFSFRPQGECNFQSGDEIKITCTNANLTGICYVTIKRKELP
jgi:hypothetical protein